MISFLRASTIFGEAFENAGAKVAVITAKKEKLRKLLGKNLKKAICFSSREKLILQIKKRQQE